MSDRDTLLSFGFAEDRVDWALRATNHRGLQPALDHIVENEGKPIPDPSSGGNGSSGVAAAPGNDEDVDMDDEEALRAAMGKASANIKPVAEDTGVEAKSIKCSECGKIFKNTALANYHAEKSGHDQFEESTEEIKPLTEEEKKAKLEELRAKMQEKRAKKSVIETQEQKANEALRRKAGQDLTITKEAMKLKEAEKEAALRKKEKLDDAKAKAAIKAQIEADKRERAAKAAREKALREGKTYADPSVAAGPVAGTSAAQAASTAASGIKGSDYKETRLQIRLASGGPPLTTSLPSESTLMDVAEYVAAQSLQYDVSTVTFATTFPRKTFTRQEFSKTLKELGLTPSAVLMAS
ncbi:hypothetical protein BOTBODRAFT_51854 [Botryobasidium botryosum FD-172 SS1]|uniref:UBX domain-containing protein n=1 Tax=Botryobasidium botryosum (strain FD-172 SS1) TaxID=930990 RepID=A0A067MXN1_BOTB1|nr:hypothetical protein BOTBODRAFT_51854 [Botryobasidium botryosum FD-172 SS1]